MKFCDDVDEHMLLLFSGVHRSIEVKTRNVQILNLTKRMAINPLTDMFTLNERRRAYFSPFVATFALLAATGHQITNATV